MNWKGEILLESLSDPSILDTLHVELIQEIRDEDGLWHVYHVCLDETCIPLVAGFLKDGPWFIHFSQKEEIIVAFKDQFFKFIESDQEALERVKDYARKLHIPQEELQFRPSIS